MGELLIGVFDGRGPRRRTLSASCGPPAAPPRRRRVGRHGERRGREGLRGADHRPPRIPARLLRHLLGGSLRAGLHRPRPRELLRAEHRRAVRDDQPRGVDEEFRSRAREGSSRPEPRPSGCSAGRRGQPRRWLTLHWSTAAQRIVRSVALSPSRTQRWPASSGASHETRLTDSRSGGHPAHLWPRHTSRTTTEELRGDSPDGPGQDGRGPSSRVITSTREP